MLRRHLFPSLVITTSQIPLVIFYKRFSAVGPPPGDLQLNFGNIAAVVITTNDNIMLLAPVSESEVKRAFNSICGLKAPRRDVASFNILKGSIYSLIESFLTS